MENNENQNQIDNGATIRTGEYGGGDMKKPFRAIIYVLILCIILGAYATYKSDIFKNKKIPVIDPNANKVLDDGTAVAFQTKTINEEKPDLRYTINVKYPVLVISTSTVPAGATSSPSYNLAYKKLDQSVVRINKKVTGSVNDFVNEARKDFSESMKEDYIKQSAIDFTLDADYTTSISKRFNTASVKLEIYEYAGGAHGITTPVNMTFKLATGEEIKLQDLFIKDSNYLDRISERAKVALREMDPNSETYTDVETGASPSLENFNNFALDDDSLIIKFSDYQVGPYVAGRPEIKIPFTDLQDILVPKL